MDLEELRYYASIKESVLDLEELFAIFLVSHPKYHRALLVIVTLLFLILHQTLYAFHCTTVYGYFPAR